MLVTIYIISAFYGFANFIQFNSGKEVLGQFVVKELFALGLAIIFCVFRYKGFIDGDVSFSVKNLFAMFVLLAFHINFWISLFEDTLNAFMEKLSCFIFLAFVCSCAYWLCFVAMFKIQLTIPPFKNFELGEFYYFFILFLFFLYSGKF